MRILDIDSLTALLPSLLHPQRGPNAEMRVVASGNFATPMALLGAVDAALPAYRLNVLNAHPGIPTRDGVVHETSFVGPAMRRSPTLSYVPSRLSLVPLLFAGPLRPDVVVLHTSVPRGDTLSLGVEVNVLPAAIEAVRARGGLVLAQLNPRMPYVYGDGEIALEDIDYAVEVEVPLASPVIGSPDEPSRIIGDRISSLIRDGATLQLGIGAVPDATLPGLIKRRGLRVWSEMFSDRVLQLEAAGALDPDATLVASFLFGSAELYDWIDTNPRVRLLRTERTNNPVRISRQPMMTSINSALEVDLFAQANASRINARIHSGFGGSTDFLVGAIHSTGGQAFIALRSWHPKADVSTIVPLLDEPTTSFQASAVVTEHGIATIWGRDQNEQARALIHEAAHPDVRDELTEEAGYLGLL